MKVKINWSYGRICSLVAVLLTGLCLLFLPFAPLQVIHADPSTNLNFQARLSSSGGSIVPDGFYNIEFKLYNVASGGSTLWTDTRYDQNGVTAGLDYRVRVVNGYLTVNLGDTSNGGTAFPSTINWDQEHWITINIGGSTQTSTPTWDGEMNPRLKLTAVPYAFQAGTLAKTSGANRGTLSFGTVANSPDIKLPDITGTNNVLLQAGTTLFTQGSIPFTDSAGRLTQNNSQFFWDNSTNRLGIGTASPGTALEIAALNTSNQLRIRRTGASPGFGDIYADTNGLYVQADGATQDYLILNPSGGNVGIGQTNPTSVLHTVATGAKTATYTGNLLTNTATSSTASINKYGLEIQSTGTWNGTSANNVGLYVSSVTGGTNNYDAIFNGGGNVGIGTTSPNAKLDIASIQTSGTLLKVGTSNATTLTGTLIGQQIDLSTNFTATNQSVTGLDILLPQNLTVNNDTTTGINIASGGVFRVDTAPATWQGLKVTIPLLDDNGDIPTGYGINILNGAMTDSTTVQNLINLSVNNSVITDGILRAINITPVDAAANSIGINLTGTEWDYAAVFQSGSVGIGTTVPTSVLHTVATGAKTANYTGNLLTNTATSSTASINKYGLEIQSTGTWNGTSANNVGLYVSTVTGGTNNYSAVFQGGNVGIGTSSPQAKLEVTDVNKTTASSFVAAANGVNLNVQSTTAQGSNVGSIIGLSGIYDSSNTVAVFGAIKGAKENATNADPSGYLSFFTSSSAGFSGERIRVSSTGNVGIGTSTTTSARVVIQGSTSDNTASALNILNSGGSTSLLQVRNDGVIATGNTINANATSGDLSINRTASPTTGAILFGNSGNHNLYYNGSNLFQLSDPLQTSGSNNRLTLTSTGANELAGINLTARTGSVDKTWIIDNRGGVDAPNNRLAFYDPATTTERLTILDGGNVGIGATNPTSALHTVATGAKTGTYTGNLLTNTATSSTASINKYGLEIQSTGTWNGTSANNVGLYVSSVTGGTNNYDAIFNGGGNVGIGDMTPSALLTVGNGDLFQVSGNDFRLLENGASPSLYGVFDVGDLTGSNQTFTFTQGGLVCTDSGNCNGAGSSLQTSYNNSTGGTTPEIRLDSTRNALDIQDANTTLGATTNLLTVRASDAGTLGSLLFGVQANGDVTNSGKGIIQGSSLTVGTSNATTGGIVLKNSGNANLLTLQSGATGGSGLTLTLPTADGSSTDCLKTNGSGVLSFAACLGGGGGGVSSVNTLQGALTIAGTTNQINVANGGTTVTLSTPQDINTTSSPKFAGLTTGSAPSTLTTITDNPLTSGATTINVASTTNYPSGSANAPGTLLLESEIVTYTGTTSTSFTGVVRGAYGTTAASHASGVTVNNYLLNVVTGITASPKLVVAGNGNVGIGIATPGNLLTVNQSGNATPATSSTYGFAITNTGTVNLSAGSDASNALLQSWSKPLYINSQGNNIYTGSGNVGIGTASITSNTKLDINGNLTVQGTNFDGSTAISAAQINGSILAIGDPVSAQTFTNGLGIKFYDQGAAHASLRYLSSSNRIDFCNSSSAGGLTCDASAETLSLKLDTQRVGIGATNPAARLDINNTGTAPYTTTGLQLQSTFTPSTGGTQTNANLVVTNAPTASANTAVGLSLAVNDSTALTNTLQGINLSISDTGTTAKTVRGLFVDTSGTTNASAAITGALFRGTSTTNLLVQNNGGSSELLRADTTNMVLKVGTTAAPSFGATTRLFTTVAEVSTTIRVGDGTNGVSFNDATSGKFRLSGTARNTRTATLVPEYAGAVMTAPTSGGTTGTMTSDFCSGSSRLSVPSSGNPCGSTEEHSYYSWTAQATNSYDIYVRYQIPDDFAAFSTSAGVVADGTAPNKSIKMYGWRTSSSESVALSLYNASGTLCGTGGTNVATGTAAWSQVNYAASSDNENSCGITAGSTVTFRVRMTVGTNSNFARAGAISFNYLSNF